MPTIVPLTVEAAWLPMLREIPVWEPPLVPTIVLAPHPDDETLGAGGLIARLRNRDIPVSVVAITDGENAYSDSDGLGEIRVPEQVEALRRLGVSKSMIYRLGLPDRDVSLYEDELLALLRPIVSEAAHIVAPWPLDFHPDHEATGRAAQCIASECGLEISFYLFWTWHRGSPDLLSNQALLGLPLSDLEMEMKMHALAAHQSQFAHPNGQPILSSELLEPARRTFEVYIQ
jgi:LmbE family N-acetylglucosaminyl deacetylase